MPSRTSTKDPSVSGKRTYTSGFHRVEMIKRTLSGTALEADKKIKISTLELDEDKDKDYPSRTIETVEQLLSSYSKVLVVIGGDQLQNLDSWYSSSRLCEMVEFIVFSRKGLILRRSSIPNLRYSVIDSVDRGCSSQMIRAFLAAPGQDESRDDLLSECLNSKVLEYVKEHDLYRKKGAPY
jgi:nicotinic acid mononucleotide adenylyltransferase